MDPRSNQPVTDWQSISNRSPVSPLLDHGAEFRRSVCMALNVRNKLGAWFNSFKQDDTPRVYEIEQRLSVIQQGYKDVSAYYTELITLWKEYKNYIELPVCTCGQCECNDSLLWEKLQQCSRVTKFLMGLNEVYEQTKSHILMLKPIPSIEKVYNMVAHDERQRLVRHVINSDSVVFQAPDSSQLLQFMESLEYAAAYNVYKPKSNRHLQSLFQQLHTHVQSSETVDSCCKASISDKGVMASQSSSGNSVSLSTNLRFENHIFTSNHQRLSTLSSSLSPSSWIIDSGASSHVCYDLSMFREIFQHLT
ncbi:uncharacterized protein LOC125608144 [Brassica napus]|uniref:uncharacterized protein LOC125608144 n=1 Tax=Brassica napus TaxID=3708 RepID=UPI0008721AFE|nr:uncharacterized protein LOC125608144 [Brassica napus]